MTNSIIYSVFFFYLFSLSQIFYWDIKCYVTQHNICFRDYFMVKLLNMEHVIFLMSITIKNKNEKFIK